MIEKKRKKILDNTLKQSKHNHLFMLQLLTGFGSNLWDMLPYKPKALVYYYYFDFDAIQTLKFLNHR